MDDEPQVLVALGDLLSDRFVVRTATSAAQALDIVENERELAVVVTDQRMPGMTGDELLSLLEGRTSARRIMVTGYADLAAVVRAVNDGQLFAYVTKPWEAGDLIQKVDRAAEQYRLVQELAAERKLLVDLINSSPDGICVKDMDLRFVKVNGAYAKMLGRRPVDLLGSRLSELTPAPIDADSTEATENSMLEEGTALLDEVKLAHLAGGSRWYSEAKAPLRDVDGKISGLVEIKRDVTDRIATSEALMESEERSREKSRLLHSILDSMNDAVIAANQHGEFLLFNPNAKSLLGVDEWDVKLSDWTESCRVLDVDTGATLTSAADPLNLAVQGLDSPEIEVLLSNGKRSDTRLAMRAAPLRDGKRVVGGIAVLRDVTEQRSLERQLLQSQKMDAVGQLAGGVAHDFNNVLAVMSIYAGLVIHNLGPENPNVKDMKELMGAIDRASALTRQLLAFGRVQSMQITSVDLNHVVLGVEKMLRRLISKEISMVTETQPDLPPIRADVSQIEQVVMNLVLNARDAMPKGGEIRVQTSLDHTPVSSESDTDEPSHVVLVVTDSGVGMAEDVRTRIFEPFFTTKPTGKGTGLGLSTVHGIVKQNGGHIEVESALGQGTRFRVYFRVSKTDPPPAPMVSSLRTADAAGRMILLVEDEDAVRSAAARILRAHGYVVFEAASVEEARKHLDEHVDQLDLLVTDMVLGEASGADIAADVERLAPRARVLFMSGYMNADMSAQRAFQSGPHLPKPFTPDALVEAVQKILKSPS